MWDVQACAKAGVPCIGLLSGGIGREELLSAGAAEVYDDPAALLDAGAAEVYDGPAALLEALRADPAGTVLGRRGGI